MGTRPGVTRECAHVYEYSGLGGGLDGTKGEELSLQSESSQELEQTIPALGGQARKPSFFGGLRNKELGEGSITSST